METKWQHLPGLSKLKSPRMYLKVLSPQLLFSGNSRYSIGSILSGYSIESNVLLQVLLATCICVKPSNFIVGQVYI